VMATVHVMPVNDIKEHIENDYCECHPKIRYFGGDGGKVVVHNSWDGREIAERIEAEKLRQVQ
jgi:hypothetical protein